MDEHRPEFPPDEPRQGPAYPWLVIGIAIVAIIAVAWAALGWGDDQNDAVTTTVAAADTTTLTTTPPPVPSSTVSASTSTTVGPSTTQPAPTTSTPPTTDLEAGMPGHVLAFLLGGDVAQIAGDGQVTTLHDFMFEARYPSRMALGADGSQAYYHLVFEDSWFSCESVSGHVMIMDVASGDESELAKGLPALSPDGSRLAYLTSDDCFPDPAEPQFFISVFDTLVIADAEGNELARYELEGEVGTPGSEGLVNLVWADDETVLVLDGAGVTYEVPVDVDTPDLITAYPTLDIPDLTLIEVVEGVGIGYPWDETAGPGPLSTVDLVTGESGAIPNVSQGSTYAVGVSTDGALAVAAGTELLFDLDLLTGEASSIFDAPDQILAIDW
jgi:hypothetical protein